MVSLHNCRHKHSKGKLSVDSPMARALLGKALDDEVSVRSPAGEARYYVTGICYDQP